MVTKKKLLITVGDSFTEGVGCYDYDKPINKSSHGLDEFGYQTQRFHELGWPNRLGRKLNYDKVINIGNGGSSQSAHLKLFFEKIISRDLSNYDILVVWMLSHPPRFSFYSFGKITNFHPLSDSNNSSDLEKGYISSIGDIENDSILETIFYIKIMEQICENNNFDLLITSWDLISFNEIQKKYKSKYYMKEIDGPIAFFPRGEYKSKVCGHPNELGYEIYSKNMFESIQKYNVELINKNPVEKFEWVWDGDVTDWNLKKVI